jgi:hypothetical protein
LEAEADLFEAVHLGGIVKLSHGEGLRVEDDWWVSGGWQVREWMVRKRVLRERRENA